jgi:hypothetical protein
MTDQTDVREFLHRMADEAGFAPVEPDPVVRKARRRLARTVGGTLFMAGALVAGALVAANGLMNAARTQMPQPGGQPTPTTTENGEALGEFTERFDSPLHGLSIGYPSGWRTRAATEPWGHDEVAFGAPDVDVIFDPTLQDDLYFALVSEPLDGQEWNDWCCAPLIERTGICATATGFGGGSTTLDGNPAWIQSCGYDVAGDQVVGDHVVFVATATRGYIIQLHVGNARLLETYDGDWFEAALETVDLRPEDALDVLSPSESP